MIGRLIRNCLPAFLAMLPTWYGSNYLSLMVAEFPDKRRIAMTVVLWMCVLGGLILAGLLALFRKIGGLIGFCIGALLGSGAALLGVTFGMLMLGFGSDSGKEPLANSLPYTLPIASLIMLVPMLLLAGAGSLVGNLITTAREAAVRAIVQGVNDARQHN